MKLNQTTKAGAKTTIAIPPAMKKALAAQPQAKAAFDGMAPSHRQEYVKWIADAKKPETAQRRVEKAIEMILKKSA